MSRYSDSTPTSHIPAYPHHHKSTYDARAPVEPNASRESQDWLAPQIQPWSYYGPPPAVPTSLYKSKASSTYHPYECPSQHGLSYQVEAEAEETKRASKGRDYLRNLGNDLATMTLYDGVMKGVGTGLRARPSSDIEKPLPRVPPPPLQHRPNTEPIPYHSNIAVAGPSSPPKTFKPSPYLILPTLHHRRPVSDPSLASSATQSKLPFPHTPPRRPIPKSHSIIDMTYSPASSSSSITTPPSKVTPRSPARLRRRATSEQPPAPTSIARPAAKATPSRSPAPKDTGTAIRCAGYTRAGQPCKRLVKTTAPLLTLDLNVSNTGTLDGIEGKGALTSSGEEITGRYCKDHAGMICSASGFYPRDNPAVWVAFDDWIPPELGQQTQTLLRITMESKLTAKETSGFIYAYELRDLQTDRTSYFKVGRTDNVPRRIGQWTNQCTSKAPTLRDIFPLPPSVSPNPNYTSLTPQRHPTLTRSFLPGAMASGTISNDDHGRTPSKAMKRWERLIHLELADLASRERPEEWESEDLRGKCKDCGVVHKEIFPVARGSEVDISGGGDNYQVVLEIICRWERFVAFAYGCIQVG